MDLKIDPVRVLADGKGLTDIFVRALDPEKGWGAHDISELDTASLKQWLERQSREWLINVVGLILGHGHLVEQVGPVVVLPEGDG